MLKKDIFVFPDMMNIVGTVKLDTYGREMTLTYTVMDDEPASCKKVVINPELIKDGSTAAVLYSPITNSLIVHYGYSALCEAMNVTHSEFLKVAGLYCFMQLDRYKNKVFIKVILPKEQFSLESDTDDYSDNVYMTADCVHPLDWQYVPTFDLVDAKINDKGKLLLTLGVCRPAVEEAEGNMHINYAGQVLPLKDGVHTYELYFLKGENAYIGYPNSRRKGRMLEVDRAVMLCGK